MAPLSAVNSLEKIYPPKNSFIVECLLLFLSICIFTLARNKTLYLYLYISPKFEMKR